MKQKGCAASCAFVPFRSCALWNPVSNGKGSDRRNRRMVVFLKGIVYNEAYIPNTELLRSIE